MRGDPPPALELGDVVSVSTPHARGSTPASRLAHLVLLVYPACAGIHLKDAEGCTIMARLPRMRGDPPLFR